MVYILAEIWYICKLKIGFYTLKDPSHSHSIKGLTGLKQTHRRSVTKGLTPITLEKSYKYSVLNYMSYADRFRPCSRVSSEHKVEPQYKLYSLLYTKTSYLALAA